MPPRTRTPRPPQRRITHARNTADIRVVIGDDDLVTISAEGYVAQVTTLNNIPPMPSTPGLAVVQVLLVPAIHADPPAPLPPLTPGPPTPDPRMWTPDA